ncbi:MAG: hypothetical protein WCB04_03685 [Mycobacteriales bacterium]
MISMKTEKLVEDYLQRLATAARVLPAERRAELVNEIRGHVADAIQAADAADEADVRNVLDRIGDPDEIVAAALDGQPTAPIQRPQFDTLEVAAVLALGLGAIFVPVVGWLVGVILVWISEAWSTRDKVIGTLGPLLLAVVVPIVAQIGRLTLLSSGIGNLGPMESMFVAVAGVGWIGGVLGAIYLAGRLSIATRAEHKRQNVLKIALGIALAGIVLLVFGGVFVALAPMLVR